MDFTFSSVITNLFFISIAIFVLYIVSIKNKYILLFEIRFLVFCMLLGIISLLLPFEFHFTKTIPVETIWPDIFHFFYQPRFNIGDFHLSFNHILAVIWINGALVYFLKLFISYIRFATLIRSYPVIDQEDIIEITKQIAKQYNRAVNFHLCYSPTLKSPSLFGIFNPKIIIPKKVMTEEEWYYVLSHEIAHYYNYDLITKFLVEIFIAIYWWNPLMYLLKRRLNSMLEANIDLHITENWDETQRIEYFKCLISLPQREKSTDYLACFKSSNNSDLTQRVELVREHLRTYKKPNIKLKLFLRFFPVMALFLSMLIIFEPYYISPEYKEGTYEITSEDIFYIENEIGSYDFYLNGEYITTHMEVMDTRIKVYKK